MTDKAPCYEVATQTDFNVVKPVVRLYMKEKTGTDIYLRKYSETRRLRTMTCLTSTMKWSLCCRSFVGRLWKPVELRFCRRRS